jgi:tRNA A37 threonylcarbamoyladenosine dehydratase
MFDRLELLIGKESLDLIKTKNVLLVGCGGVGGICATSLIRNGISKITIIDYDTVEDSNLNRQEVAYQSTLGRLKVDALKELLLDINPNVNIKTLNLFLDESNINELITDEYDYVIDCCDSVKTKEAIIKTSLEKNIKFISSMGTGNRLDPSMLEIIDVRKTEGDPLAKIIRKWVKDNRIKGKIPVVCSREIPLRKGAVVGSSSFVPTSAGLLITSYVIRDIIGK